MEKVPRYRPDIDGLRAIAILLVVAFHSGLARPFGGFVGVDVFFVISGYLITGIIDRETRSGTFSFASFYERRIRRIGPALALMLAVSAVASVFLLIPWDLRRFGGSLAASVLFYANFEFYQHVGYFDGPAIEQPLLHTWSLAVEEQFYLIWPSLFLVFDWFGKRVWRTYAMAAVALLSLGGSQMMLASDPAAVFYLLPFRMWELLLGGLVALAPTRWISWRLSWLFGALGFSGIAYAAIHFTQQTPFPGVNGLFPCLGAALLILAGVDERAPSRVFLGWAPMRFVGKISYSLYLFHWPLLSFATLVSAGEPATSTRLALVAASFAAAALSWRFVETPARRMILGRQKLFAGFAALSAALCAAAIIFHATGGLPFRAPPEARQVAAKFGGADCRADPASELLEYSCPIGAGSDGEQYDFVVWGDSHAHNLSLAMAGRAAALGLSGMVLSNPSCPPFLGDSRAEPKCEKYNAQVAAWLKIQTRLRAVYLAGIWAVYANQGRLQRAGVSEDGAEARAADSSSGLDETLNFLRDERIKTVVVEDTPVFPVAPALCTARASLFGRPTDRCVTLARSKFESDALREKKDLHDLQLRFRFTLLTTADAFCDADVCLARKDGVFLYYDTNHLARAGSLWLGAKVDLLAPISGG